MPDIDFVVLWVDGTDTEWKKQKNYWQNNKIELHPDDVRYRDWGLFKYWFRCVEQNAPWVRKVHLVTNGQCPKWLNLNNSKLQLDIHGSFMNKISVPTFSSHPIELQLHKIKDLAEHFVYFNDDMFLINPVQPDFFFKNGIRTDFFCEYGYRDFNGTDFGYILRSDINEINKFVDNKRDLIKNKIGYDRWFSSQLPLYYKAANLINYIRSKKFVGFSVEHTAFAYTKSLFEEVWENCGEILRETITHKFRTASDANQYIFRYWSIINGHYVLNKETKGLYCTLKELNSAIKAISGNSKYPILCINDTETVGYDEEKVQMLRNAFEHRFHKVSSFENQ